MIKINLAAKKSASAGGGTGATGTAAGGTGSLSQTLAGFSVGNIRNIQFDANSLGQLKELPLKRIGVIVVTILVANYLSASFQADELSKLDKELDKLKTAQKSLKAELDKTKGFEAIKVSLENDERTMKTKIEVIQKLLVDRQKPPKVLLSLSNIIPPEMWLNSFTLTASDVKLTGYAMNNLQVPEFQKNLSESADFKDVNLVSQTAARDPDGSEIVSFTLEAKRR
jgi:Tfp pilus assembly protein PilN